MKNIILPIIFILSVFSPTMAQNWYCQVNAGYGFAFNGHSYLGTYKYSGMADNEWQQTDLFSLGRGYQVGALVGKEWTPHFATEIQGSYLQGHEFKETYQFEGDWNYYSFYKYRHKGQMLRIIPTIKISTGGKIWNPFLKSGLSIGLFPGIVSNSFNESKSGENIILTERLEEISGGISFGYFGSAGVDFSFHSRWKISAEMVVLAQAYLPEKRTLTRYTENGEDILPQYSRFEKEYRFQKNFKRDGSTFDKDKPTVISQIVLPFSSIGFQIGIRYNFTQKASPAPEPM